MISRRFHLRLMIFLPFGEGQRALRTAHRREQEPFGEVFEYES